MIAKTRRPLVVSILILSTICFVVTAQLTNVRHANAQQAAQQPRTAEQAFKNIQVIKNMPANQLQNAMAFMSASLGVDCSYCHTPPAMEKDDKPTKATARRMLVMVNEINKNFGEKMVVNCATCHRGSTKPITVPPLPSLATPFAAGIANASQELLPSVDEVLDRYIKALGGARSLDKVTTRVRKGSIELAGLQGTFEVYEVAPTKSLLIGSMPPPLGSLQQAFDGTTGWMKTQGGVFDMRGETLAQARREAAFYGDVKLKEQFKLMSVAGIERIDGREFYVVRGTRADDQIEKLFFDVTTGLLARRSWEVPTYFGALQNANDYDEYRKVGSVRLPFAIRKARSGQIFRQRITDIKLNVPIDDARFKKPVVQK